MSAATPTVVRSPAKLIKMSAAFIRSDPFVHHVELVLDRVRCRPMSRLFRVVAAIQKNRDATDIAEKTSLDGRFALKAAPLSGRSPPGQNKGSQIMKTIVICSGGLDSVSLAHKIAAEHELIALVSFDYGQRHKRNWTSRPPVRGVFAFRITSSTFAPSGRI